MCSIIKVKNNVKLAYIIIYTCQFFPLSSPSPPRTRVWCLDKIPSCSCTIWQFPGRPWRRDTWTTRRQRHRPWLNEPGRRTPSSRQWWWTLLRFSCSRNWPSCCCDSPAAAIIIELGVILKTQFALIKFSLINWRERAPLCTQPFPPWLSYPLSTFN